MKKRIFTLVLAFCLLLVLLPAPARAADAPEAIIYISGFSTARVGHFRLDAPGSVTSYGTDGPEFLNDATYDPVSKKVYFATSTSGLFGTVDAATGVVTQIASGRPYHLVAYNPADKKLYGLASSASAKLYTVDRVTGAATEVVAVSGKYFFLGFTVTNDGRFIAIDAEYDGLVEIDPKTGAVTRLISAGFTVNYGQDIATDYATGKVYWAAYNMSSGTAQLYYVNLENLSLEYIGNFPDQASCFAILSDPTESSEEGELQLTQYPVAVVGGESTLEASAAKSGSAAQINLDAKKLDKFLSSESTGGYVEIDAAIGRNADTADLAASAIRKIAAAANDENKNITGLKVTTDTGTVTLDAKALAAIAEQAKGNRVAVRVDEIDESSLTKEQRDALSGERANAAIIEVSVTSGGKKISDLGGGRITATMPYELKDGENASDVCAWCVKSDGTLESVRCRYDAATGTVSFTAYHLSEFAVGVEKSAGWVNPFADVTESDEFYGAVEFVNSRGLMKGVGADSFDPEGSITRGMAAELLYRLEKTPAVAGECPFEDVESGAYYENAVIWAAESGIVEGYGDGRFGPEDAITREQLATIIYRYEKYNGGGFAGAWMFPLGFGDAEDVSDWAYEAVCWCVMRGIISGDAENMLAPGSLATRAQTASAICGYFK